METVPPEVLQALASRNPFRLLWDDAAAHKRYQDLQGPAREVADRLVEALLGFPPPSSEFEIVGIVVGLGGTGYTVTVVSGTHLRVTVTAKYREAQQTVSIRDFYVGARKMRNVKKIS